MKTTAAILTTLASIANGSMVDNEFLRPQFIKWTTEHSRTYSGVEFEQRFQVYQSNHNYITKHNQGVSSFTVAHNQFSDMTNKEYRTKILLSKNRARSNDAEASRFNLFLEP